jgi:hypothetical protein
VAEQAGFEPAVPSETIKDGLLTAYKVIIQFEFTSLHQTVVKTRSGSRHPQALSASTACAVDIGCWRNPVSNKIWLFIEDIRIDTFL